MARPSYGPEAKKRSLHLFTALLDYANDELDGDEGALNALRPQIQVHWQSEQRLVVRTKVRLLESLTKLANIPLNGEQIKEALRRFEDFLAILDDNRPNKGGSEVWHFTLNLWYKRSDRTANLNRFEQEWEQRRPLKSKQVAGKGMGEVGEIGEIGEIGEVGRNHGALTANSEARTLDIPWLQICRDSLEAQQYQRLTTNPLTITNGITFDLHELYLPLGLVERKRHRSERSRLPNQTEAFEEADESDLDSLLSVEELFHRLQSSEQHRVAIVGEPGAGKTTLLQKIASWLLDRQMLPIWISLADLQGATLENYLLHDWLKQATRRISVSPELQEALADQVRQGRVWLLLDAIDEMAIDAATALANLARQLRGWIADAHVILTCRLNVWDGAKNPLEGFTTYCNLGFSHRESEPDDQVGQFIDRWFQDDSESGAHLRQELDHPKRKRLKDALQNPLRLALLCRSWALTQGNLPNTKALLYQQFVETIYEWKQERFATTLAQRQQLNRVLGQVALRALLQPDVRFRLPQSFVQMAFGESLDLMTLALQLGWLNQVGLSITTGEKIYAFYHPTFQEYFAAQAIPDGSFFFNSAHDFPAFSLQWREVILFWLGRIDIATPSKDALMDALTKFQDECGGFYAHRAYFLAATGLAEFPQYSQANAIANQLLEWRFGAYPVPLCEGARVALLQTDRTLAIATLEQFIQKAENPFIRWQAAYTLGKTLDWGNSVAIATLAQLIDTLHSEALRLQVVESLGKIHPDHPGVIGTLEAMLESTQQATIRRRAAYSLGKIDPGNSKAIAMLETIIQSATDVTLRLRTAENLISLDPQNSIAIAALELLRRKRKKTHREHRINAKPPQDIEHLVTVLEQRLATANDPINQRRLAYRLGTLQPGHLGAIDCLLQLLLMKEFSLHKRVVEDLKEILINDQLANVVVRLGTVIPEMNCSTCEQHPSVQIQECYKLLWHCAQRLPYTQFADAWRSSG
jgi:hypothetical protein